jgi:hypothetical protein
LVEIAAMSQDPWTDSGVGRGGVVAELEELARVAIERHEGDLAARLRVAGDADAEGLVSGLRRDPRR